MRNLILCSVICAVFVLMIASCQTADNLERDMYYTNGRDIYIKHCQNCHGAKGEGLAALTPPLTDTVFLKANKQKLACIIKNGLKGEIVVHGKSFNDQMPPNGTMADIDIAQVIVYITNANGNNQGMYTPAQVAADLAACR
ncbi:c-type cytochrome [Pedobacter duraquae]|uniref:Cbb3-type cytochrome c oxidase subunit III n=1 Tax=Pedobacter duraquae TaxID=425511 RepID=A0A4R6IF95_9SPHI|nr:cytochrome c [Pedobacter duraquae]TDO21000.1 cbb3-type cytochrome c oxidase subunit III [Pedobacter duraquae]